MLRKHGFVVCLGISCETYMGTGSRFWM